MRVVDKLIWVELNGLTTLIIGEEYKGIPLIMFEYDQLIVSKKKWEKYEDCLVFKHRNTKPPKVIICEEK